jgi:hypothetical protein
MFEKIKMKMVITIGEVFTKQTLFTHENDPDV